MFVLQKLRNSPFPGNIPAAKNTILAQRNDKLPSFLPYFPMDLGQEKSAGMHAL